jgi:ubiquinone/menaquinone biosynthesis C-methylase UbiE
MAITTQDIWSKWILQGRFDSIAREKREATLQRMLYPIRDALLTMAAVRPGDTVLDVGCGDGLIAFAALEKVGEHGKVIFSDISNTLLDHCQAIAHSRHVLERCQFLHAPVEDLSALPDEVASVVTIRSVLLYVQDKQKAFSEIYRVLKPQGRVALYEPIGSFSAFANPAFPDRFYGYDVTPIKDIAQKVHALFESIEPWESASTTNYDEQDLFTMAERAGFTAINARTSMHSRAHTDTLTWEQFLLLQLHPRVPTFQEAMLQALTPHEIEEFTNYLRPLVEAGQGLYRDAWMYLQATK